MATQLFPEISIDFFEDWGEDVRVRRIQPKLKTLVEQAKKKGLSLEEEMKAQRFKDYKQLVRACPQFDLTCWPSELAELGSGFVHYFHLLWFLVGMLILVFLLQIPIMSSYSQNNWLVGWHWHSWGDSWTEKDTCGCIGGSNLSNGPANSSQTVIDYGTSCRIWDEALCWEGCPDGFHLATDDSLPTCPGDGICCQSGAAPDCGADCRKRSCTAAGGQWIPATKWELAGGQWIPEIKCEMPKAGVFSNPGRWCCTRWCFVLLSVSSLLTDPNFDDPLNASATQLFRKDRAAYDRKCRDFTKQHAMTQQGTKRKASDAELPSPASSRAAAKAKGKAKAKAKARAISPASKV